MKFKVFTVSTGHKRILVYQLEVDEDEVRPGTSPVDSAVGYLLLHMTHKTAESGTCPLSDSKGIHLTRWLVLDDSDIYWFLPGGHFDKKPTPIKV